MAGAYPTLSTAAGQQSSQENTDPNVAVNYLTIGVNYPVPGGSAFVQHPVLQNGGDTPGPALQRLQGSRPGNACYFQHLENWNQLSCLDRIDNYTVERFALLVNPLGKRTADIFLMRNAHSYVPLLLINIANNGNITVTNLDSSIVIWTADQCFQYDRYSAVFQPGGLKLGGVTSQRIYNEFDQEVYIVKARTTNSVFPHYICAPTNTSSDVPNTICALSSHHRVVIQMMQENMDLKFKALTIVAALKFYHQLTKRFTKRNLPSFTANNIHQILFDEACKLQIMVQIDLPSKSLVRSTNIDADVSNLTSVTEAVVELAAMCPIMYKHIYFIKDVMKDEIIFVGEKSFVQASPDCRFRNISSQAFVFLYEVFPPIHSPSHVFLGNMKIGSVLNPTQIERHYSHSEMLIGQNTGTARDETVTFQRQFSQLCSTATVKFQKSDKKVIIRFEGSWDIYWKAIIFSFATRFLEYKIEAPDSYVAVSSLREAHDIACRYNQ